MAQKGILEAQEVEFLRLLHNHLYFKTKDGKQIHLRNGVHQGSPISPALFNIYMEEVIAQVKEELGELQFWYKLYADDLVIVTKKTNLLRLLISLIRQS